MSTEENKATARRWSEELWGQGNMAVADEIIAPSTSVTTQEIPSLRTAPRTSRRSSACCGECFPTSASRWRT